MSRQVAIVTKSPDTYRRFEKSFRLAERVDGYEQAEVRVLDLNKLFTVKAPNKNHFAAVREKVYNKLSAYDITFLVDHTALRLCVSACKGTKKNDQDSPYEPWYGKVLRHSVGGYMVVLPDLHEISMSMTSGEKWLKNMFIEQMNRTLMNPESAVMSAKVCVNDPPKLLVAKNTSAVKKVLTKVLAAKGRVAADIETDDIDPYDFTNNLLGISFSMDGKTGAYCVYSAFDKEAKKMLDEILRTKLLIFHNGAFDTKFLKLRGHAMANKWVDTMLLAHLFDERIEKSLKAWAWFLTDQGGYDDQLDLYKYENKVKKYGEIPLSILGPYGAQDAAVTWRIWNVLSTRETHYHPVKLPTAPTFNLFKNSTMPFRKVLTKIELNGIYVNRKAAKDIKDWCADLKPLLLGRVQKDLCVVNMKSPKQLQEALFGDSGLGLTPTKYTRSNSPSCDFEALESLHENYPDIEGLSALMDLKYIENVTAKFIDNFLKYSAYDGRMHGNYGMTSTVSGRIGMSDPNLQNVPRDLLIRNLLCAPPGRILIEADLKSAEYAALAAETQDPYLLMIFATGQDLHNAMFRIVKDKPDDYIPNSDERLWVKTITYGIVYGRGAPSLALLLGISTKEAQAAIDLYMSKMPKVEAYIKRTHAAAKKYGYLSNGFGRIRRLYPKVFSDGYGSRRCLRQSVNFKCQSGSADYTNLGIVGVDRDLMDIDKNIMIVHTVHDCVIVESDPEFVEPVKEVIEHNFSIARKELPTNMRAEAEECQAWGEGNVSRLQDIFTKYA